MAHPRRRRDRRPPRRAADQGPDRAGAAHRAGPHGVVDARGAGGRRQAALGGAPARPGRRRPGHRHRPGLRARLRQAAAARSPARRRRWCSPTRRRPRRRSRSSATTTGAGWSRSGWSPRASTYPAWRSASTPRPRRRRCSSPRPSAASCAPGTAARPRRCSCRRCRPCSASPPSWRSSATTCSAAGSPTRATSSPPRTTLLAQANAGEAASAELETSFEALGSEAALRPGALRRRRVRPLRRGARRARRRRWTSSASPGLLEPDQVRELLHHRQSERARKQKASRRQRRTDRAGDSVRGGLHPRAARGPAP